MEHGTAAAAIIGISSLAVWALSRLRGAAPVSKHENQPAAPESMPEPIIVDAIRKATAEVMARSTMPDDRASMPRGIRNRNPGNIRYIADPARAWNGQVGNDNGYGIYSSDALGVRALARQLMVYQGRGLDTVRKIIGTWAPASENNTSSYIRAVSQSLGVLPDDVISVQAKLPQLVVAIIKHENGIQPYTDRQLAEWVYS